MPSSSIPTGLSGWASGGTITPPAAGRVTDGWEVGSPLDPFVRNYAWDVIAEMSDYLTGSVYDVDIITGRTVTTNSLDFDALGTGTVALTCNDGSTGTAVSIGAEGWGVGYFDGITIDTVMAWSATGGLVFETAEVAENSNGFRLPYKDGLELEFPLTDGIGGWTPDGNMSTASDALGVEWDSTPGEVVFRYASGDTGEYYREIGHIVGGYNAEAAAGAVGYVTEVIGMSATLDATGGDDVLVQLIRQNRSSGSVSPVARLPPSGTPHSGGPAAFSSSSTGPFKPDTYRYYLVVTANNTPTSLGTSVRIRDLLLTVRKRAAD